MTQQALRFLENFRSRCRRLLLLLAIATLFPACGKDLSNRSRQPNPDAPSEARNVFDDYLNTDFPPADGFDFAVGDRNGNGPYEDKATSQRYAGWHVATHFTDVYKYGIHTGEDWSGNGPPNSDLGQAVYAIASGKVAFADFCGSLWGNVVMIDHVFYQNNEKKRIRSAYAHLLEIKVRAGDQVRRRQAIGAVGQDPDKLFAPHLHLELRWDESLSPTYWPSSNGKDIAWVKEHYTDPSTFINSHRRLPVPQQESALILIDQPSYKMRFYQNRRMMQEYDVSFGQGIGPKEIEGDNKTPTGMYFVIQKHAGKFSGPYGGYYGGYWIKINYPNPFDARRARAHDVVSEQQLDSIAGKWGQRLPTIESTALGGGIGFHGWIKEWENSGPRHLSWGCVVMHNYDISKLYDQIPEGTMVVIF
jgi:murein DD-endopeptidase MepM/ murein hydrolase activator NlpD